MAVLLLAVALASCTDDGDASREGADDSDTTVDRGELRERESIPGDVPAELADTAQACFDGDMEACDDVYRAAPDSSDAEAWGGRCGRRLEQRLDGDCRDTFGATEEEFEQPESIPGDVPAELAGIARACFDGDMEACDDVYRAAPDSSDTETWGASCGGRLNRRLDGICDDVYRMTTNRPG